MVLFLSLWILFITSRYNYNEENGLIIPNGDISAFTKALFRLMEDNKLWQKLSYKSLQTCKQFDVTTIADKWDILFNELELNKNKYDYTM